LELSESNIRKAYGLKVGSLLEFLRRLLEIEGIPDYADIVRRQFGAYMAGHAFTADQTRFLRAVQNVFLQRQRLERVDLYDEPLTSFGADAVERWFTEEELRELLGFVDDLTVVAPP
jgi:type I restriction enzyme R subunit